MLFAAGKLTALGASLLILLTDQQIQSLMMNISVSLYLSVTRCMDLFCHMCTVTFITFEETWMHSLTKSKTLI